MKIEIHPGQNSAEHHPGESFLAGDGVLSIQAGEQNMLSYAELLDSIQDMVLQGLSRQTEDPKGNVPGDLAKKLAFIIDIHCNPPLDGRVKRIIKLLGRHFNSLDEPHRVNKSSIIAQETLRELDIFSGSHPDHRASHFAQKIHKTLTTIGYVTLCKHLAYRKTIEELEGMQSLIAILQTDHPVSDGLQKKSLLALVRELLAECHLYEGTFLSFWHDTDSGNTDILSEVLRSKEFGGWWPARDWFNTSPVCAFAQESLGFFLMGVGPMLGIGSLCSILSGNVWVTVAGLYLSYSQLTQLPDKCTQLKCMFMYNYLMQKKLIAVAQMIKKMKALHQLLQSVLPTEQISSLLLPNVSDQLRYLLELLEASTFGDAASYATDWGKIHVAYRLMMRCRDEFLAAYATLGYIDFLASTAQTLTSQEKQAPYCFAAFLKTTSPALYAEEAWTPLLDSSKVVTNNIAIGHTRVLFKDSQAPHNSLRAPIITGPNAHGKTTVLRWVGLGALMSQTLGIAPASSFTLTPLSVLTSINIQDNRAASQSLFVAGVVRMAQLQTIVESNDAHYLILIDEPFVGTSKDVAEPTAFECLKRIGHAHNALLLATSHLRSVRELAEIYPGLFANYFVAEGFKLHSGTDYTEHNYTQVAVNIIREGFGEVFAKQIEQHIEDRNGKRSLTE